MRLALYGGSFDPPHVGHLMAIACVLGTAPIDRLVVAPCHRHRFDKQLTPYPDRLAMAGLAASIFGSGVEVSDIEGRIGGQSRTLTTVRALLAERPGARMTVVVGADLLVELPRWFGYPELATIADFFVVGRTGHPEEFGGRLLVPVADVSSTAIRERVRRGETIEGLVPRAVGEYIRTRGLYRTEGA